MPIPFTYSGNDDNALDALVLSAGVSFSASGNVHQSVDALSALLGLTLSFSGNDREMLEALAAQYTPTVEMAKALSRPAGDITAAGWSGRLPLTLADRKVSFSPTGSPLRMAAVPLLADAFNLAGAASAHFRFKVNFPSAGGGGTNYLDMGVAVVPKGSIFFASGADLGTFFFIKGRKTNPGGSSPQAIIDATGHSGTVIPMDQDNTLDITIDLVTRNVTGTMNGGAPISLGQISADALTQDCTLMAYGESYHQSAGETATLELMEG